MALALGGDFEHRLAEIKPGRCRVLLRERQRKVAGAAAQIQRAVAGLGSREPDDAAFPEPVQAEALKVVDQIVPPGDGGEKVVDPGGALFAGVIEGVAHAESLAHGGGRKSQSAEIPLCESGRVLLGLRMLTVPVGQIMVESI